MKKVYKYKLEIADYQTVTLPAGAKILCIKTQHGEACLWALVDPNQEMTEDVTLRCAGTGHPITEENLEYIDTVLMYKDALVFHFFKVISVES